MSTRFTLPRLALTALAAVALSSNVAFAEIKAKIKALAHAHPIPKSFV